jgi:hypothetical protein
MCSNKIITNLVKKIDWNIFGKNLEKFNDVALEKETKERSNKSVKCVVTASQKSNILKLMESSGANCKEFRASLMKIRKLKLCGIHFFRWDGTPRQSTGEINWAVCHYPSSSIDMINVLKTLLGSALVLSILYSSGTRDLSHTKNGKSSKSVSARSFLPDKLPPDLQREVIRTMLPQNCGKVWRRRCCRR